VHEVGNKIEFFLLFAFWLMVSLNLHLTNRGIISKYYYQLMHKIIALKEY